MHMALVGCRQLAAGTQPVHADCCSLTWSGINPAWVVRAVGCLGTGWRYAALGSYKGGWHSRMAPGCEQAQDCPGFSRVLLQLETPPVPTFSSPNHSRHELQQLTPWCVALWGHAAGMRRGRPSPLLQKDTKARAAAASASASKQQMPLMSLVTGTQLTQHGSTVSILQPCGQIRGPQLN
jgi:hypothetical protein